jgi:hypothetical protein
VSRASSPYHRQTHPLNYDLRLVRSGFGYKRDDPSTLKTESLPVISEKGSEYSEDVYHIAAYTLTVTPVI